MALIRVLPRCPCVLFSLLFVECSFFLGGGGRGGAKKAGLSRCLSGFGVFIGGAGGGGGGGGG